uniref:peptidylprolyl isomerase n=1 Tax=Cyclopterus lumpus TaxID=8103 RepID=A0A8C3A6W9_CYCLU
MNYGESGDRTGYLLASLFGLHQEGSQGNESFQYTAPKQPRKSSNSGKKPAPAPAAPAVLFATAVQTFRYINGQYVKQGKLGAAVLGNHTTKEYKLLLYLSQQKQVAAAKIHVGFVFTVQPNNYCTFYDEQRQNWSLMFESEKALWDFCKEVCLAKANTEVSLDAVVVQDLSLGEGQAVENGDSVEVVYTGWLLQNHAIGQVMFDSNQNKDKLLRLKVGAGKVIKGWEEGMLGLKKAGRRLVVIPANQAYGSKGVPNRVPANSTLVFETELRRVKFCTDNGSVSGSASSRDSAAPSPIPSPAPSVENLAPEPPVQTTATGPGRPGEPPLRAKSNSLSEQLTNPDATKAKLISRMAKMGQPMLPFLTGVASQPESSDSELEVGLNFKEYVLNGCMSLHVPSMDWRPVQGVPCLRPMSAGIGSSAPATLMRISGLYRVKCKTVLSLIQMLKLLQIPNPLIVFFSGSSDVTSFLMTEARQHNTEIRLAVGKVADKVDQLTSKMDDLQRQGSLSMAVPSMSMETSMIMHNIQRIVQENECLKKEVFEKSSRIEEQNRKIGELINQNQRYVEQSNLLLEQRNDSLKSTSEHNQARLLQVEQDKVRLTEDLASSLAQLSQLHLEATDQQQKALVLQSQLSSAQQGSERHCQRIAALEAQLEERTQAQYRSEKQRRKEMELRGNNMEEEVQDLKADKESLERTFSERKNKWQTERQRRDEEVEELRKSSQQEVDNLRTQLRNARTSTDSAASEQVAFGLLSEFPQTYSGSLKFTVLKQSRDLEEQTLLQRQGETEELQVLQQKVRHSLTIEASCVSLQVKRVMNGVFHSLRGEFDLGESYSGQAVLGVIVTTIKNVTLQLLGGTDGASLGQSEEEEEEEEENDDVKQRQGTVQNVHVNGEGEVREEKDIEADSDSRQVIEIQMDPEVAAEKETETVTGSKTQSQAEALEAAEPRQQETEESEVEQETAVHPVPEISTEGKHSEKSADLDDEPEESSPPEDGQETVSEMYCEPVGEMHGASEKAFGPPANPPPPPNSSREDTR